jgi:K+-sensing histidine kinase KdpD
MAAPNRTIGENWAEASLAALTAPPGRLTMGRSLAVGLGLAMVALVLRVLLQDVLGTTLAFVTFYPAIALAGWIGGLPGAIIATIASTVLGGFFFLEPAGRIPRDDLATLVLFGASGAAVGTLGWWLRRTNASARRANRRAAVLTAVSGQLYDHRDRIEALEALVQIVVPGFADWCAVELVDRVTHPVFRVAHRDPSRVQGVYQLQRSAADAGTTLSSVAGDEPSAYLALDRAVLESLPGAVRSVLDGVGARSYVGVPLRAPDERLLGHLAIGMSEGDRKIEPPGVAVCIELGRIVSTYLDRMQGS